MEKREPLCTAGGSANWYNHYGKQSGVSFKRLKIGYSFKKIFDRTFKDIHIFQSRYSWRVQMNCCVYGANTEDYCLFFSLSQFPMTYCVIVCLRNKRTDFLECHLFKNTYVPQLTTFCFLHFWLRKMDTRCKWKMLLLWWQHDFPVSVFVTT